MPKKQFNNLCKESFPNSCHFIFKKCSQRIQKKYNDLKLKRRSDLHSDEKLIGKILNYSNLSDLSRNNPYLITPDILRYLVNEVHCFNDENELLWGDNIDEYLEDFFIAMILDIQEIPEYAKHLLNFSLIDTNSIKEYFQVNFSFGSSNYDELKDKFIDFTYNQFDNIEILEEDSIFSFIENYEITLYPKNDSAYLSFQKLPKKLDLLAKYVLLPLIDRITLENLINKND
ncbi:TPA: hypothetical protein U0560_000466 [Streptococcus suis]|uniref:hypothetical protein n=1 Tax=Streptococcus suis TaxID=1307 RepID=UPI00211C0F2C|nr:hypothetical protein [Streptococcus suis]UUM56577.1 hypothetical protein NQZ93_04585 [Streptococcus suis]HEL2632089.1 hypothetical protein [Streptococcus suis]HEM2688885.1 hypothetical protein [Streptococcus suis]